MKGRERERKGRRRKSAGGALAGAAGLLGAPSRQEPGLNVGKGGGETLAFVDQTDLSLDAGRAAEAGEETVTGKLEKRGGVYATKARQNVLAREKREHRVAGPRELLLGDGIGGRGDGGEGPRGCGSRRRRGGVGLRKGHWMPTNSTSKMSTEAGGMGPWPWSP